MFGCDANRLNGQTNSRIDANDCDDCNDCLYLAHIFICYATQTLRITSITDSISECISLLSDLICYAVRPADEGRLSYPNAVVAIDCSGLKSDTKLIEFSTEKINIRLILHYSEPCQPSMGAND